MTDPTRAGRQRTACYDPVVPARADRPSRALPRIVVLGDSLLDVVVRRRAMVAGADRSASIRLAPGGQGANVAVRLSRHGSRVRLVAPLGADRAAELVAPALADEGVELDPVAAERTGVVVVLLDRGGERTMLSDRAPAAGSEHSIAEALRPRLAGADWIHASGYALLEPGYGRAVARLLGAAGCPVSADAGSVHAGRESAGRLLDRLGEAQVALFFANRAEAEAILDGSGDAGGTAGIPTLELLALVESVRSTVGAEVAIVTDGPAGSAAATAGRKPITVRPARARRVLDTTGAGDAYAAGVIAQLAGEDRWPPSQAALRAAMTAGSRLAAQVVGVRGAQGRVAGERAPVARKSR